MPVKKRGIKKEDKIMETKKIFAKDKNLVYLWCNENYANDFSIKPKDIVGKTDYDFYDKKLADKYRADDKKVMKNNSTLDMEEEYKIGEERIFVHTVKTPIRDEEGLVSGIMGVFWDISKEKEIKEKIKENEKKYRQYIEYAPYGIFIANQKGEYVDVNSTGCEQLGYTKEEVLKLNISNIVPKDLLKKTFESFQEILKKGKGEVELVFLKKDRSTFPGVVTGVVLESGNVMGFVRDITDLKEKIEEMEKLNKFMIGRELKMLELKEEIKRLQTKT